MVSLTQRTFEGGFATMEGFNWVGRHVRELALVATEHPRLLPFLQLVDGCVESPSEVFEREMGRAGLYPSARRRLERWGPSVIPAVPGCEQWAGIQALANFANLLDRIDAQDEPNVMFAELALRGGIARAPDWFMRALYREVQAFAEADPDDAYPPDFELVANWIASRPPRPDRNQQAAGWSWIVEQAWRHRLATDVDAKAPWPVPCETLEVDGYGVVPIRTAAELYEEAAAMRNCLATYEADCRSGRNVVFSVRKGRRRVADLVATRPAHFGGFWSAEVRGKANCPVPELDGLMVTVVAALVT